MRRITYFWGGEEKKSPKKEFILPKTLAGWEKVCNFAVSEMTNPVLAEWG